MRMILIDNNPVFLDYLESKIQIIGDHEIIGKYTDTNQSLVGIKQCSPDVVFLETKMPRISGIEIAEEIKHISPQTKIVFVSEDRKKCCRSL